jgi:hypothetical protein
VSQDAPPGSPRADACLPGWARAADLLSVVLLLIAVDVLIGGPIRLSLGPLRISMGSLARPALLGLALLAVRHWWVPHPAVHVRVRRAWHRLWHDPAIRSLSAQFWAIRAGIVLVGYLSTVAIGPASGTPFRVSRNEFLNLPARWDAGWYLGIATDGYRYRPTGQGQQNIAFLPAFPVAMRLAGGFLGVNQARMRAEVDGPDRWRLLWSGVLVSLFAAWAATVVLFGLARRWMDDESAAGAALLVQAYPFALFYGAPYTEALYLLACVGALAMYLREAWAAAFGWGLLAGMVRPNGFLLGVLLGVLWLTGYVRALVARGSAGGLGRPRAALALAAAAPGVGVLAYSAMVYRMSGHPLTWTHVHAAWGREYRSLTTLATGYYDWIATEGISEYIASAPIDALNLSATLFVLGAVYPVWRRFGLPYAAFMLATVVPPLMMGGMLSMGRITASLFPAFMWLAAALGPAARRALVLAFVALQAFAATLFFTWRPLF